ncbi:MAG: ABC transporter permease [Ruminococcaceae bacterium]|nr:ABC transporter permease [Oscillospiraceae bacterium]
MQKSGKKQKQSSGRLALAPYSLWSLLFIVVPLIFIAYYAFTDESFRFTTENITRFFTATSQLTEESGASREVRTYLLIFARSLKLAAISTVICLLLGYPLAYIMARAKERTQKTLITLVMIPMWMNFLIRTYAWMTILQDTGILNGLLELVGLSPAHIIGTETAVIIGMVYDYFPYMILPIYSIMAKMDIRLLEAAKDLGCNGAAVLRRVIFPLSLPGVISGINMVLIPSVSTFYISQKLGNGKFFLIGDAIEGQYIANNLHFAAAIAFILMVVLLLCMALLKYLAARLVYGGESYENNI